MALLMCAAAIAPEFARAENAAAGAAAPFASCDEAAPLDGQLGYMMLLKAALTCEREGRMTDATYFLLVSQIRLAVDGELLFARDVEAKRNRGLLLSVHSQYAGSGPEGVYRDAGTRAALFARLMAWRGTIAPGHDAGWAYKRLPEPADVEETVDRAKHNRLEKLRYYAALISNDEYYASQRRLNELSRENGNTFRPNTPAMEELRALQTTMQQVERDLAIPPADLREPKTIRVDPDADYRTLHTGMNGPERAGHVLFEQRAEAEQALASVASGPELDRMLTSVDFSTEIVVVIAAGERPNATGKLVVTELEVGNLGDRPAIVSGLAVGVMPADCPQAPLSSRPFVVVAKKRPAEPVQDMPRGRHSANFADGCTQAVGGGTGR
ncbi:MAG: hypothetical protein AB7N54_13440 [Alphaproteobacteria bacterium]